MSIFIIIALIIIHCAVILMLVPYVVEMIRMGDFEFTIVTFIMIILNALMVLCYVIWLTGRL